MIRWLDENPLGKVLASISAALVLVLVMLALAWSLPPRGADDEGEEDGRDLRVAVPELAPTAPIEQFAVITERPVFNESRQPEIAGEDSGEERDEEWAEVEVEAPDVELAGVVITPSLKMATLKPKNGPESLIALEGGPLEGNYGSWHVSSIEPRSVVLRSGDGEEVRLDLQVHDAMIKEPPKPPPSAGRDAASAEDDNEADAPLSRAEEIRQRIAERREELRRAAEEKEQNQDQDPDKPADYRSAIQQMIQGRRTEAKDENEQ